jgi:kynurenine formamidase
MRITIEWKGQSLSADLNKPLHIAIPLQDGPDDQPNAYGAPPFETTPYKSGDFVGSIDAGSPVNFYNIRLNPHGNGTHTESVGHIKKGEYAIHNCLQKSHVVAELISVYPTKMEDGDIVIHAETLDMLRQHEADALIVRTLPNQIEKQFQKYTGTNPPYFTPESMQWIHDHDYKHLLTDLPSVDKEEDAGALKSHRIFWQSETSPRIHRTITEMVFVANDIKDGIYLLDIQIAPLILDASPSRPVLFKLKKEL